MRCLVRAFEALYAAIEENLGEDTIKRAQHVLIEAMIEAEVAQGPIVFLRRRAAFEPFLHERKHGISVSESHIPTFGSCFSHPLASHACLHLACWKGRPPVSDVTHMVCYTLGSKFTGLLTAPRQTSSLASNETERSVFGLRNEVVQCVLSNVSCPARAI